MTGGWVGSARRDSLPPGWHAIRRRILARDHHRCVLCGAPASEVDHVGDRHDHSDANLRSLCTPHHARRSSAQGNAARWAVRARRPPEQHPGLR